MRKLTIALMAVVLLFAAAVSVHAMETPDPNRVGSLTLVMEWEGEKLNSGSLAVCRVGQIISEDGDWKFRLIPELKDSGLSLENLNDAELPKQLEQLAKEKELPVITASVREGRAVFEALTAGLYLVTQQEACQGLSPINSFLVSLPQQENGTYLYDLTAQPKVSLEPEPTEPTEPTQPTQPTEPTEPTKPTEPELPQTGQLNWPVPVMSAAGVSLFALGWYLCFGKKNSHET